MTRETVRYSIAQMGGSEDDVVIPPAIDDRFTAAFIKDGGKLTDSWAAIVLIRVFPPETAVADDDEGRPAVPQGYILVIDHGKPDPLFYKLPGGKRQGDESPLATAVREVLGETGLNVPAGRFEYEYHGAVWKGNHWSILASVNVGLEEKTLMHSFHPQNEGEVPEFISVDRFYEIVREGGFLPPHYQRLKDRALILPLDRDRA